MSPSLPWPESPPAIGYFDTWATDYAAGLRVHPVYEERFCIFDRRIAQARARAGAARPLCLDLGCGPGTLMIAAARRGFRCVGVDGSERMLELARAAGRDDGVELELRRSQVPLAADMLDELEGCVDLLVASSLVEYIEDERCFAEQCRRLLAPGATALISFANRRSLHRAVQRRLPRTRWLGTAFLSVQGHQRSDSEACGLFASAGLRPAAVEHFALPMWAYGRWRSERRPPWLATMFLLELRAQPAAP